jgi:hypothetical protein
LAVVLRRQQAKRASRYIVGLLNLESPAMTRIVKDHPLNRAHFGRTGSVIETLNTNARCLRWCHKIIQVVGDARSSTAINQDVK